MAQQPNYKNQLQEMAQQRRLITGMPRYNWRSTGLGHKLDWTATCSVNRASDGAEIHGRSCGTFGSKVEAEQDAAWQVLRQLGEIAPSGTQTNRAAAQSRPKDDIRWANSTAAAAPRADDDPFIGALKMWGWKDPWDDILAEIRGKVLLQLETNGPWNARELSRTLNYNKPAVNKALYSLQAEGKVAKDARNNWRAVDWRPAAAAAADRREEKHHVPAPKTPAPSPMITAVRPVVPDPPAVDLSEPEEDEQLSTDQPITSVSSAAAVTLICPHCQNGFRAAIQVTPVISSQETQGSR